MHAFRLVTATALLFAGAPALAQPAALTVDLQNFSFNPQPIRLRAGQPVTITFVNRAGGGHDFTAAKFFASSRVIAGSAPDGEIELAGHQTRSITLAPAAGTYQVHCSHFLHKQMGMSTVILVN